MKGEKKMKIGIMGGTFDPVHYGHLFIAQTALDQFKLDKILFIPIGKPAHKEEDQITDSNERMHMLKLAIKSNPKFDISTMEIDRQEISYTIDTIKELRQYYDKGTQLYFIMGSDAFKYIETWKEYEDLLRTTKIIIMTRQIFENEKIDRLIDFYIKKYNAHIKKIEIPFLDISSTDIKSRIIKGASIKYLLPENVEEYIINKRLYIKG